MKKPHREHDRFIRPLIFGLSLFLAIPCSFSLAQAVTPITSSGLNTQIGAPTTLPGGQTVYDITGGTRPGNGPNLFHSFGDFNVPTTNIANFLNETALPTSNILGRVTGGNISNIFGTIQTTGFGNANLYLVNPAGFLFGPTATVNVGGMVTFTSANYLKLADGVRFNAIPNASADALLSAAPVAAFGFLGSNPGAITVQGSQLTVTEGTGISLVGGNMTVQAGTLTAPSGDITLVSVGKPSNPTVGGEVVVVGSGQGAGFTPTGFRSLGSINLTQGSTVDVSRFDAFGQHAAGTVVIRGGQFVMDNSTVYAGGIGGNGGNGGNVEVTADQIALSNGSFISTSTTFSTVSGNITLNANTVSATDSTLITVTEGLPSGAVTIQGLRGSGTYAQTVSLRNTAIDTFTPGSHAGPITIRGDNISLNHTTLETPTQIFGGPITLVSRGSLSIQDSILETGFTVFGHSGPVDLRAGTRLNVTSTMIFSTGGEGPGGSVTMAAPTISLRGSTVDVRGGPGGTISITGRNAVSLTNGTVLTADDGGQSFFGNGGNVLINGGARFTSQQSTISAQSSIGNGGTIHVEANKIELTDSQLNTSTSGGPGTVGGSLTVNAKNTTLTNSQLLSTATEGQGGTINITSPVLQRDASSVIDASSQSGTNGTVTINGVIQP